MGVDDAGLLGHLDKPAAVVAVDAVGAGGEQARVAEPVGAELRVAADEGGVLVPDEVVADVQVEVAVAVEVGEGRGGRPVAVAAQAGGLGDVLEGAVAPVAVEGIRPPSGDEQVGVAVVVDIADGDAVAVAAGEGGDPGGFGGVLECAIAAVVEEAVVVGRRFGLGGNGHPWVA